MEAPEAPYRGPYEEPEAADSLSVTGIRGTLSQEEIQRALEPRMPKLSRCLAKRMGAVEWLAGDMKLSFHVARDGSVLGVSALSSSIGDCETERCLLEVAAGTRFHAPHGGEADFAWPFEVPLDSSIAAPSERPAEQVAEQVSAHASEAKAECGEGTYAVTAYVHPEGRVLAAGVTSAEGTSADALDCVAAAVLAWTFAPAEAPAKIHFDL